MELSSMFTMCELPVTGWFMGSRNRGSLICTLLRYLSNVASNLQSAIKGPSKMVAPESDSKSIDGFLFGNRKRPATNGIVQNLFPKMDTSMYPSYVALSDFFPESV